MNFQKTAPKESFFFCLDKCEIWSMIKGLLSEDVVLYIIEYRQNIKGSGIGEN